jgi:hypothetical protein
MAGSQQIYKDFADNGKLDKTYSKSELRQALKDAAIQVYNQPKQTGIGPTIHKQLSNSGSGVLGAPPTARQALPGTHRAGGTLPFTGVDLALMTAGGLALLGLGAGLRRVGRSKA